MQTVSQFVCGKWWIVGLHVGCKMSNMESIIHDDIKVRKCFPDYNIVIILVTGEVPSEKASNREVLCCFIDNDTIFVTSPCISQEPVI